MKIFRKNSGSKPLVKQVFAFDPQQGTAAVLFRTPYGPDYFEIVTVGELELIRNRVYEDVAAELRKLADVITGEVE